MQRSGTISTWNRNPADEEAMGAAHAPIWRRMIDVSVPEDLRDSTVLDYGCNQGGFLRMLYDRHPFRAGVGIDIARESVARAELLKRQRPIDYRAGNSAAALGQVFDYAFSHEVLYLLPDLAVHAARRQIDEPGGEFGDQRLEVETLLEAVGGAPRFIDREHFAQSYGCTLHRQGMANRSRVSGAGHQ